MAKKEKAKFHTKQESDKSIGLKVSKMKSDISQKDDKSTLAKGKKEKKETKENRFVFS